MRRLTLWTLVFGMAVLLGTGLTGCSKKPPPDVDVPSETGDGGTEPSQPIRSDETQETGDQYAGDFTDAFFDYDRSDLRPDALTALEANARFLQANSEVRVTIEGHCDERGTTEYNLALGERRARAAQDYLTRFGIDGARLSTISYGEERPFDLGHSERAWAMNRRAHFVAR